LTVREFLMAAAGLAAQVSGFAGLRTTRAAGFSPEATDRTELQIGSSKIEVGFGPGAFDLPRESILAWIAKAAHAVAHYYGVFPVPVTRVRVYFSDSESGPFGGRTWGSDPPLTRISLGSHTTQRQLDMDWLMTHEFVHLAFPDVAEEHHWIEEGIATYVEPIARVQIGDLTPEKIWADMLRDMPKGEPQAFDRGLDHTHTWARTYWGGALFCLLADVRIRERTNNRKGLEDALRGIRDAGGTIEQDWPVERAFQTGDQASGTSVLTKLYADMKNKPVYVGLNKLWRELGVNQCHDLVCLTDNAPLAQIRKSITSAKPV
jgi:hypothetical protein